MSSAEPVVIVERHDAVALVRPQPPGTRNAMNAALAQATVDAVEA